VAALWNQIKESVGSTAPAAEAMLVIIELHMRAHPL
jgi:hypothetical protein